MATRRQVEANRANARASTGPRTPTGKRKSAGNASRHGLTGSPEQGQLLAWYRVIVDDPDAALPFTGLDAKTAAALRLAEAEAHLAAVRAAEVKALAEASAARPPAPSADDPKNPGPSLDLMKAYILDGRRKTMEKFKAEAEDLKKGAGGDRLRLLGRYRAEAESRRLTALKGWIRALEGRAQ